MGLHQDADEADFLAPVVSVSLGDSALFRIGGPQRKGPTRSLKLVSGDVLVMGGPRGSPIMALTDLCRNVASLAGWRQDKPYPAPGVLTGCACILNR